MVEAGILRALAEAQAASGCSNQVLKGRAREIFVSNLLRPYLAPAMGVCSGVVIDSHGRHSRQIDVIVYDRGVIPPVLVEEGEGIIPCESVLATVEVKSTLTAKEMRGTIGNARSVKALKPEYEEVSPGQGFKNSPICYLFAFRSSAKKQAEETRLRRLVRESNSASRATIHVPLSGICVAGKSFLQCVDASARPPRFVETASAGETGAVLDFLVHLIEQCTVMSAQRRPILVHRYIQ